MIRFLIFLFVCFFISNCKPKECFKETGSVQKIKKEIGYFKSVWAEDNISVELVEGNEIFLEAGEKLINGIDFKLREDSTLIISNKNSCSWLRSYDIPVKVYVGINNISYINWRSYGNLTSEENLRFGYLQLDIFDVNPKINLNINAIGLFLYYNLGADITLEGTSSELSIFTRGYGKVDASNLATHSARIIHQGQNNILVQPLEVLDVLIESSGNVVYTKEPKEKKITIKGSGKIIKQ
ncbi:hypothetical protein AD998_00935 [bacterium 336/3]|nr:hypothetical protein AD998_00935 [bacterium 336/3]